MGLCKRGAILAFAFAQQSISTKGPFEGMKEAQLEGWIPAKLWGDPSALCVSDWFTEQSLVNMSNEHGATEHWLFELEVYIKKPYDNSSAFAAIRPITCYSYILMISLDCKSKMANDLIIWPFILMISLDLMKSSDVRIAGDRSIYCISHNKNIDVVVCLLFPIVYVVH